MNVKVRNNFNSDRKFRTVLLTLNTILLCSIVPFVQVGGVGIAIIYTFVMLVVFLFILLPKKGFNFSGMYFSCFSVLLLLQPLLSAFGVVTLVPEVSIISSETVEKYHYMTLFSVVLFIYGWFVGGVYNERISPKKQIPIKKDVSIFLIYFLMVSLILAVALAKISELLFVYVYFAILPLVILIPAIIVKISKMYIIHLVLIVISVMYMSVELKVRSTGVSVLVAVLIGFYYRDVFMFSLRSDVSRNVKKGSVLPYALTMLLVLSLAVFFRFVRGYEEYHFDLETEKENMVVYVQKTFESGDLGAAASTMGFMELVPKYRGYLYGQSYWRIFFVPIPRFIMPEKPENTQRILASWIDPSIKNYTLAPGAVGDAYINFGVFGTLVFGLFGFIFRKMEDKYDISRYMVFASSFVVFYHLARGAFTNAIVLLVVLYMASFIYKKFLKR